MKTVEFDSPVFYDKKVQELNTALEALTWIQHQYPICVRGQMEEGTFPEAYYNDGSAKNLKALPEGNSISFFAINGDITEHEDEFYYNVPLSLYVWADLTKVYPEKAYDYTGELIKDVIDVLDAGSCNNKVITTDNVFEGYSYLEKQLQQNTMRPYSAFKIDFTVLITKN